MAFNISKFSAHLNKYGTLKQNRYEVIISKPKLFVGDPEYDDSFNLMPWRAESIDMPTLNLQLTSSNRYGIGPKQSFATNIQYPETIGITFLETQNSNIHKFFTIWSSAIFEHINPNVFNHRGRYLAEYKDNYSAIITIKIYTEENDEESSNVLELLDAFPTQVASSALSWSDINSLMRINTDFTFSRIRYPLLNPQAIDIIEPTPNLPG